MSIFRVYFYDQKGNELAEHPLNGKYWLASSGWLSDGKGGFRKPYRSQFTVADFANMRSIKGEVNVTIADFPGHDRVGVKVWQGPNSSDKSWLVSPDYFSNRS